MVANYHIGSTRKELARSSSTSLLRSGGEWVLLWPEEAHEDGYTGAAADAEASRDRVLHRLHNDLQALSRRELTRAQLHRRWPATQIAQWRRWQNDMQAHTGAGIDLACLLAHYGADYDANVQRLSQAYQALRGDHGLPTHEAQHHLASLLGCLSVVYRSKRDSALLIVLLELQMPTRELRQRQKELLCGLWDRHRLALLRAAAHSPVAQHTLGHALIYACRTVGNPIIWRAYYRHLQSATYVRDRQITRTALRLITRLRLAERRYELG